MQWIAPALRRNTLTRAALLAALIGLSGCALPFPHHEVYEGSEITAQTLTWLHLGETSRAQVLEKFGAPDIDFVDQHVIAYAWSGTLFDLLIAIGFQGGTQEIRMRRAFMIQFDSADKVAAFSIIDRPTKGIPYDALDQSRDAHSGDWRWILDQWLAERRRDPSQSGVMPK